MWCVELKIGMADKHHRHSKHTKFRQNLRRSLQCFGDWAWNDHELSQMKMEPRAPRMIGTTLDVVCHILSILSEDLDT